MRPFLALATVLALLTLGGAETPKPAPPKKPAASEPPAHAADPGDLRQHLFEKVFKTVHFNGMDDPKTTLTEALDSLVRTYDLSYDINDRAFRYENLTEVGKSEIAQPPLPGMTTTLDHVLHKILSRVPVPSGATFLLRRDHIEITTGLFASREIWGTREEGPFLPVVHVVLKHRDLQQALKDLALQADYNILIDSSIGEEKNPPVSAELYNVSLDNAVRLLARMAGLAVAHQENVLFVTTPEKAAQLQKEQPQPKTRDPRGYEWALSSGTGLRIPLPQE
jgi:hypothetical protein